MWTRTDWRGFQGGGRCPPRCGISTLIDDDDRPRTPPEMVGGFAVLVFRSSFFIYPFELVGNDGGNTTGVIIVVRELVIVEQLPFLGTGWPRRLLHGGDSANTAEMCLGSGGHARMRKQNLQEPDTAAIMCPCHPVVPHLRDMTRNSGLGNRRGDERPKGQLSSPRTPFLRVRESGGEMKWSTRCHV